MEDDEVIKEVRRIRDEIAARFNYDVDAIGAHYLEMQERLGLKMVSLPPRKPLCVPTAEVAADFEDVAALPQ